jgi:hypothetical protein
MCATDEGKEKGEKWCKRAIWENTLPEVKHLWKSVDNLTSGMEPTPNEEQPAHRGTVNSRDLVASLERASGFSISAWHGRCISCQDELLMTLLRAALSST